MNDEQGKKTTYIMGETITQYPSENELIFSLCKSLVELNRKISNSLQNWEE